MAGEHPSFTVVASSFDPGRRQSLLTKLRTAMPSSEAELRQMIPHCSFQLQLLEPATLAELQHGTEQTLDDLFARRAASACILISDALVDATGQPPFAEADISEWAKHLLDRYRAQLYGTIAILPRVPRWGRVADIDRVASVDPSVKDLSDALALVALRLAYLTPPLKRDRVEGLTTQVLDQETDFLSYFKLRHQIYRIMGYLETDVENARSGMEMDWCDTASVHMAAFARCGVQKKIVGTARVVTTSGPSVTRARLFQKLAGDDVALKRRLDDVLSMMLPIFQSQSANALLVETLASGEICGELSRVTVAYDYRGAGISKRLVDFAIEKAQQNGVRRLFLECLEHHEPVYQKHGFIRAAGLSGRVLGANRTMIVMELDRQRLAPPTRVRAAASR